MKCKLCGNEMTLISQENISMTEDVQKFSCDDCGRIFKYKTPTKGW